MGVRPVALGGPSGDIVIGWRVRLLELVSKFPLQGTDAGDLRPPLAWVGADARLRAAGSVELLANFLVG